MTTLIFLVFHFAVPLICILGVTGVNVRVKVMGFFILAIGVQFIISAVNTVYEGLIG
jgi:small neutral amino acid transporter SnatA (MarC family)